MQRHESYKPSGLDWLGEVPAHWQVMANRALFRERREAGQDDLPVLSVSLHTGVSDDEQGEEENARTRTRMVDRTNYQRVRPGDVAYNMMRAWQGAIGAVRTNGLVSPAYVVATPTKALNPAYFEYLYRTEWLVGEMNRASKGITDFRKRLYWQEFKQLSTLVPPREEQDRIVAFLDEKTAEIDAAIAKKERLIELLSDQKKILVQRAVTRGLTDGVSMRDSGVAWIGDIPSHWSVKRVRAAFKNLDSRRIPLSGEQRGKMTSRLYDYYGASGAIDKVDDYLFDEPLILIAEDGANLVMRNLRLAFIASGKYWVNNHAHILKPFAGNMTYLCEALECVDYNPLITGAAQPKLTKDALKGVEIPFPPPEEQSAIASYILDAETKYREIEDRFRSEITLLAALKQTTIANVVTGKIKV